MEKRVKVSRNTPQIPSFKFVQDEKFLTIKFRAVRVKFKEMKVSLKGDWILFKCPPYNFRLKTPGEIVDDERAVHRHDFPSFVLKFPKSNTGEHFEHLEFLNKLFDPVDEARTNGGMSHIQVLASTDKNVKFVDNDDLVFTSVFDINTGFGFAFRYKIDLNKINILFSDIFEVDPQVTLHFERRLLRFIAEERAFDKDHYLTDFFEDGHINQIIAQECPYKSLPRERLDDEEVEFLMKLPKVHIPICDISLKLCLNSLLEILFACCFDRRCTFFSESSESVWNMNKLAATLCWHEAYYEKSSKQVFVSVFRRAMIYPLKRNFKLCQVVFDDLKVLLQLDTLHIIRVLIKIYHKFKEDDRYILNNMFIKPYLVYIQMWDENAWRAIVKPVLEIQIKKHDLNLGLEDLEKNISYHVMNAVVEDTDDEVDDPHNCDADC